MDICTKVTLRQRLLPSGKITLYLDYYPAIRNPKTNKSQRHEYMGIYLYGNPSNRVQRDFNQIMLEKAENISPTTEFIERFLRNLILGENNVLRNRDMLVGAFCLSPLFKVQPTMVQRANFALLITLWRKPLYYIASNLIQR